MSDGDFGEIQLTKAEKYSRVVSSWYADADGQSRAPTPPIPHSTFPTANHNLFDFREIQLAKSKNYI